jgi:hypothetical protein
MLLTTAVPGSRIRVSGTYRGTVTISSSLSSGKYPGVLAEDVEFIGS